MKNKTDVVQNAKDPIIDKVLDLQIYNLPLFKICQMLDISQFDLNTIMEQNGYIKILDKYVVKPKPTKNTKKPKKATKKRAKKEKTKKELLEEEYKRNPAKRGTFDYESQVWVVNTQLVEIIDLQLEGKNLSEIAKHMKMSKPALTDFMKEKEYVLEDGKFVPERQSKAFKEELLKIKEETEKRKLQRKSVKPKFVVKEVDHKEVSYKEEEFDEYLYEFEKMYNWYLKIKEHPIFNK